MLKLWQTQEQILEDKRKLAEFEALRPCPKPGQAVVPPTPGPSTTTAVTPDRCPTPEEIAKLTEELAAAESQVKIATDALKNDTAGRDQIKKASAPASWDAYNRAVAEDAKKLDEAKADRDKLQKELDALKARQPCPPEQRKADTQPPPGGGDGKTGMNLVPQPTWYFCDNPRGYYPAVATCSTQWRPVQADAPPPTAGDQPPAPATQQPPPAVVGPDQAPSNSGFGFGGFSFGGSNQGGGYDQGQQRQRSYEQNRQR